MTRNILRSSIESAYFSIIFQILCRCITFGLNSFIIRNVGREVLGIMNVRLLLLESTILFLSREAINRATLSVTSQQTNKCTWAQIVNQIWLTVPTCILLSFPCLYIWQRLLSSVDDIYSDQYNFSCYAVIISCIMEMFGEVPVFVSKVFCFVKLKIALDTIHILVRSVIFLLIILNNKTVCIYAFGIAQLSSGIVILIGYYGYFWYFIPRNLKIVKKDDDNKSMDDFPFTSIKQMFPGVLMKNEKIFNANLQILTMSFIKQGVLKQILTEGEKYVMSVSPVLSFSDQATYDIVNNLGSLAARYIFRPIEDSSYFYFTQTISRDVKLEEQNKEKTLEANSVLKALCLVFTTIGLMIFVFGQSFSGIALYLYGGEDFVADGLSIRLLQWHCLAILFLAINGITEGFMFATNTSNEIDKYNYYMGVFSISFLVLSYLLTYIFGPVGFIVANCLNMFCRICYSTNYIKKKYSNLNVNPLSGILVGKYFSATLLIVGVICKLNINSYKNDLIYSVLIGGLGVLLCASCWILENKNIIMIFMKRFR